MYINFDLSDGYKVSVKFVNRSYPSYIMLNYEQILAVISKDLLAAKRSGLSTDIYMSLIDPDYPAIVTG